MATSKNTKKAVQSTNNSAVTITSPKIEKAWVTLCETTSNSDSIAISAIGSLVSALIASDLSIRDVQKVIKATGQTSSLVKVSHVEGLTTWADLRSHADFTALPLPKQLASAVSAYKLLGAGNAQQLASWSAVEKATKEARKVKAKKSSKKTGEPVAESKNPLVEIRAYFTALDFSKLSEKNQDIISEINAILEDKMINA